MTHQALLRFTAQRNAHIAAALEARRTSHVWSAIARDWPADVARYRAEADKHRERARWNINRARDLAAWIEWKQAHEIRQAA